MHRVLLIARPEQRLAVCEPHAGREGEEQSLDKELHTDRSPFGSQGTPVRFPARSSPSLPPRRARKLSSPWRRSGLRSPPGEKRSHHASPQSG